MAPRTKSCTICRKKRMKCDATIPQCLMCVRFGRQCPGLEDELLIVDMTKTAHHGMQKRKKKHEPATQTFEIHAWAVHPTRIDRISQQATVTEAFFAHFLSYFTSEGDEKDIRNRISWLHRLPQLSVDGTNDALSLAVQATASSYCAVETNNQALTRHAWDLYGRAIQTHSRSLSRSQKGAEGITVHMISTSVLFSLFEAMQATSASAYRAHVYGAAKMFEVTDPNQCSLGVLCQIFFHIRTQMAFVQLISQGEETPIDVKRILYGALEYEALPIFQRLTSQFSKLVDVYNGMQELGTNGEEKQPIHSEEYTAIKDAVDLLWREYNETASLNDELISWHDEPTSTMRYRDAFTALTVSYFSATRVLLAIVAPSLASDEPDDHYESILQASQFMETRLIGCAYMRMAAPLLLVALHAPNFVQRDSAIGYFDSWNSGRSMRGISALAMQFINRRTRAESVH